MTEPRYAPARADGMKPWVVIRREWGRQTTLIVWAETSRAARYEVVGRQRHVKAEAFRATPADMRLHA